MTTIRPGFTHILSLIFCLTGALHISLHAAPVKVYNYTERELDLVAEYLGEDGKTLEVFNNSRHRIYIRIGYGSARKLYWKGFHDSCISTGFVLDPGQIGKIYKNPDCVPINVSGHFINKDGSKIGDIPRSIIRTWMDDSGTLRWDITHEKGISYRGRWSEADQKWVTKGIYGPYAPNRR